MSRPTVILADDHRLVVAGLKRILDSEFDLVATVSDGRALVEAVAEHRPDVVLVDISMPLLNGLEATRQLVKENPDCKVIILTMHSDVGFAAKAFESGASGFVLKHSAPEELATAIREVLKGRNFVTAILTKELLEYYRSNPSSDRPLSAKLTPRQREVLQLIAEGKAAKEIADLLKVSTRTVEFHKYKIMDALQLRTTAELTRYAIKHGLITE